MSEAIVCSTVVSKGRLGLSGGMMRVTTGLVLLAFAASGIAGCSEPARDYVGSSHTVESMLAAMEPLLADGVSCERWLPTNGNEPGVLCDISADSDFDSSLSSLSLLIGPDAAEGLFYMVRGCSDELEDGTRVRDLYKSSFVLTGRNWFLLTPISQESDASTLADATGGAAIPYLEWCEAPVPLDVPTFTPTPEAAGTSLASADDLLTGLRPLEEQGLACAIEESSSSVIVCTRADGSPFDTSITGTGVFITVHSDDEIEESRTLWCTADQDGDPLELWAGKFVVYGPNWSTSPPLLKERDADLIASALGAEVAEFSQWCTSANTT